MRAFETTPYFQEPYYVGFNIGGYELGLQPEDIPITDKIESVVAYWGVGDIQKQYDRLMAIGASKNETPTNV